MTDYNVIYLPLDERPCNFRFAEEISQGTPIKVIRPNKDILGDKKIPANFQQIKDFLLQNAKKAQCCVLSLDMLLYGGIVPSRLHNFNRQQLSERLHVLTEMKNLNKDLKIYAFALIMRCPCYSSDDEEPNYYETCGREIFLTGQVKHKLQLKAIPQEEGERLLAQYAKKTGKHLAEYEQRRKINRDVLVEIVNMLGKEIDFFVIPQDDSAPIGYTSMDREYLKSVAGEKIKEIAMYPGADEVGMTLLARAACDWKQCTPKIHCVYCHENSPNIIPLYEDRPLKDTLVFQVQIAGCQFSSKEESDIELFLNYPSQQPVEVWQDLTFGYVDRNLQKFSDDIALSISQGKKVALADGAYCNGGDKELMMMLAKKTDLFKLASYAGWNTSSNTLGTAICLAVFNLLFGKTPQQNEFLAERFYEDLGYCGYVRKFVVDNLLQPLGYNYFNAGSRDGEVAKLVCEQLETFMSKNFPSVAKDYKISKCQMPWKRMFEVDLTVSRK